jgi:hypothetical protein
MSLSQFLPERDPLPSRPGVYYKVCWSICMCHDNWCEDKPRRPALLPRKLSTLVLGPFQNMLELYQYTNLQTSRKFLHHFQSNVGNPELCLTFFSGGSYYGLSTAQKKQYLRKKALDIDNDIIYTDNEFSENRSRLCFEFDMKTINPVADWMDQFVESAIHIAKKIAISKQQKVTCHLLVRPVQKCKNDELKYGMHIVFSDVITTVSHGHKLSGKFKKKINYIDSCYDGNSARLRPMYSRKVNRAGLKKCHCNSPPDICACLSVNLSTSYDYSSSLIVTASGDVTTQVMEFKSTYSKLLSTSIWIL